MVVRATILVVAVLSGCDSKTDKARKVRDSGTPIEATPADLVDAYRSSEIKGDKRYAGRPIRLTATVDKIRRDGDGTAALVHEFHEDSENKQVMCLLDGEVDLPIGPKVVLRCAGVGLVGGVPTLAACKPE